MLSAIKVRLYPTEEQAMFLRAQFGAVRFVYNKALHIKSHLYRHRGVSVSPKKDLKPLLAVGKKSRKYSWLKQYDSIALQQSVLHLHQAFERFFDPKLTARYPQFKRRHGKQSSYHCTGIQVFPNAIKLPKMRPIEAKIHRDVQGKLKSITVSLSATGKYYASLFIETQTTTPNPLHRIERAVGIDLGITDYCIESNTRKTANPRFVKRAQGNLRRKQRHLSRKQKGSANRAKARLTVAKCHEKITAARADFQHKLSRRLIDENQAVIVETLKSANMMQNHKLAQHIGDCAWHSFVSKLAYKAKAQGKVLVKLDQWFASSKTCHCCGHKETEMPLQRRRWVCPDCGVEHDRDINAARNIMQQGVLELKAAGHVVSACGGLRQSHTSCVAA